MELTKYQISNFKQKKVRTDKTDFQESIAQNNKELFFAYINHFKDKIDLNQEVNKAFNLLQLAYHEGLYHKKDFTIFEFLYNHPKIDKNKESIEGGTLLNIAANKKDFESFKRFEQDGIHPSISKDNDIIYSFFKQLPILSNNVDFTLLKYILKNPDYKLQREHLHWCMNSLNDYYYRTGKKEDIKEMIFELQEKGGGFWDDYQPHKLFLYKVISKNDVPLLEEILKNQTFIKQFKKLNFYDVEDHPLSDIVNFSINNLNILDIYKKNTLPFKNKKEDYKIFYSLFKNYIPDNIDNTLYIFKYLINDCKLDPFQSPGINSNYHQSAVSRIFDLRSTNILPFLKIMDKENNFDINTTIHFDDFKTNILEYAYEKRIDNKNEVLNYITQNEKLNLASLSDIEQSTLFLSLVYNDKDLFYKSLDSIDYKFKNKKGDNILIHLLEHNYKMKYFEKIMGANFNDFQNLLHHIILHIEPSEININSKRILKSAQKFKKQTIDSLRGRYNDDMENNVEQILQLITISCEKALLTSNIDNNMNSEENRIEAPQQHRKRI